MSFSVSASGHIAPAAADGSVVDQVQAEVALYEALKAVLGNPAYGVTASNFSGSHVSGSLHLPDDGS